MFKFFIFFFLTTFNLSAKNFLENGLLCQLKNNMETKSMYEAYIFKKTTFTSLYFKKLNNKVIIKESAPEPFKEDEKHLTLRGIKINKKKLEYSVMGGSYKCTIYKENDLRKKFLKIIQ